MSKEKKPAGLTFPCDFPIKAIGPFRADLDSIVYALVSQHMPDISEAALSRRPSSGGKYLAITMTVRASSQQQLDEVYRSLSACEHLTMVL